MKVNANAVTEHKSISIASAQGLSTTVNTRPHIPSRTPRWLLRALPWVNVETGIFRINRVACHLDMTGSLTIECDEKQNQIITKENLRHFYLFRNVDDACLETIISQLEHKKCKPGDVIIEEGTPGDTFYVIFNGDFEVSFIGKRGDPLVLANLKDGDYFGELSLLHRIPRQASVKAKTAGHLCCLSRKSFNQILKNKEVKAIIEVAAEQRLRERENMTAFGEPKLPIKVEPLGEPLIPNTLISYDKDPVEIHLSVIQTVVSILTRISDIYNMPYNQVEEQLRVTSEMILEREEWEVINNRTFGLLHSASARETIVTRTGPPTPDDLDNLLSIVWKKPSYFLAHPKAIAAFGRECTKRGVPPPTVSLMGGTFITWRGIPILPTEKLEIENNPDNLNFGTTSIILIRVGEEDQGVVGLYKTDIPGQTEPGLSVHFMGINERSTANYLLTKYFAVATLVPDAIAILKNVEIGHFHDDE